ncbi:ABC transporter ATP-binding protein [Catellatospora tritici]|uniref:ABC transporter ATP-binding protein n=1 Tax=Catellatospora tritici TaxID=2851566 RepID=UPI001C2CEEBA|nr:ABC transporter ATP-binding protein [Catellatospora tritici]MBV1850049.1 ABC transporter ATP-binding protein/permease [Catellatospora tritici]
MPPQLPHLDPGVPDTRGPARYLWWLIRRQWPRALRASLVATTWMIGLAIRPYLIARAIDDGLRAGDTAALLTWVAAIVGTGVVVAYLGIMRHRTMTFLREDATARSSQVLLHHIARLGAVLPRKVAAGEVATVSGTDVAQTSWALTMTGPGVGAVLSYATGAFVLWGVDPMLALFVLLGVPVVVLVVGPLLNRLQRVDTGYRQELGLLTTRAGDIVSGLRVLAGVGGRDLFARRYADRSQRLLRQGYRVGAIISWVQALTVGIPALFLAAIVWLAARMAAAGEITVGEMVAVYGYVAILAIPVFFLLEGGFMTVRGLVAARRIIALLRIEPNTVPGARPAPEHPADLHDPHSGLTVPPQGLIGVAASDPADAIALADRLAGYVTSEVTWGGLPVTGVDPAEVRARILVADHDSHLFSGPLRDVLRVRPDVTDAQIAAAVRTASADDVVDSLPGGLDAMIEARGRNLSGGQRQRIRLAQHLLAEPDVLILIDPTSAVDSHTEARIADRLREHRTGRATVVCATSPLLLDQSDLVAYLHGGRVVAVGVHDELLKTEPGYRALVAREADEPETDAAAGMGALR